MPNPYELVASSPETILYYVSVTLVLVAWSFFSLRKTWKWYADIRASTDRWEFFLLPPDDLTGSIVGLLLVTAANLFLLGLFVYVAV